MFSPHYNSISYCLFEHNLRFSLTHRQSQRKFLVQGTFKIQTKQSKKKRTTFKRSSSHTQTFTKNTPEIQTCRKVRRKKREDKKLQTHYSFTKQKQAFTHIKTNTHIRYLLRFKIHHQIGE